MEVTNRPDYNSSQQFPEGMITQGAWFTLLFFATQMLVSKSNSDIEALSLQCVNAILKHHYNPENDLICELLNQDLSRPDNDKAQLVLFSHCFQTLWIIMHEALRRKDRTLFDRSAELLKRHLEVAWDDVYGGLFGRLDHILTGMNGSRENRMGSL